MDYELEHLANKILFNISERSMNTFLLIQQEQNKETEREELED